MKPLSSPSVVASARGELLSPRHVPLKREWAEGNISVMSPSNMKGQITAISHKKGGSGPGESRQVPSSGTCRQLLAPRNPLQLWEGAGPR